MKHFIFCCFLSVFLLAAVSVSAENVVAKRFSAIADQLEADAFSYTRKAKKQASMLQAIAGEYPNNINFAIRALYGEASINYHQLISDSTLLTKCIVIANTWGVDNNTFESALLNYTMAMCYSVDGNYANAFSLALKSLEQFQRLHEKTFVSKLYCLLGNICLITQSKDMALEYYQQAMSFAEPGQRDYYLPFLALYTNLVYVEEKKQLAIDSLEHFLTHPDQCADAGLLAAAGFNLRSIYYMAGDEEKGMHYYDLCKHYIDSYGVDNYPLQFGLSYNIGYLYKEKGNYAEALKYSYRAKATANTNKSLMQRSYVLSQIADIYAQMNNVDSAYHYLEQYNEVRNQIASNSSTIGSYKAYMSIYLESLQKELTIATQEHRQFITIIIFVTVVLLLALALLIAMQQKRKTIAKQLALDGKIQTLQKNMIESQQRELSAHALLLSGKNEILQQISHHTKALPGNNDDVRAIKQIVKNNLTADQSWENFMMHFNKVHSGFFDKLKAHSPSLTENNLRLCAYLRISMSSKQIAQVLSMSTENVRKSSYRLKKKLALGENESLYDFLRRI